MPKPKFISDCRIIFFYLSVCLILMTPALADHDCFSIVVGKNASVDGCVLMAHNEDDGGPQIVHHHKMPRRQYNPGDMVTLLDGGSLEQVEETWAYIWAEMPGMTFSDSYLNEWGVCIASDACRSREDNPDLTNGGISYMLRKLVAQRAKTAREGVRIAGEMVERFGYNSSGRTYPICDPDEGWIFCAVNGKHWLARRVPDDEVAIIANTYTVDEVDLSDTMNFLASPDIIDYAVSRGWYNPETDGLFDFAAAYANPNTATDSANFCRQWGGLRLVASEPIDLDAALPFSVKPKHKLSVAELMTILRDHYEETDLYRADPETGDPHSIGVRTICARTTQTSFIARLRGDMPPEFGLVYWFCLGPPCTSFFLPYYFGIRDFPEGFASQDGRPGADQYEKNIDGSSGVDKQHIFWMSRYLHRMYCSDYDRFLTGMAKPRDSLELAMHDAQNVIDSITIDFMEHNPDTIEFIAGIAAKFLNNIHDAYIEYATALFPAKSAKPVDDLKLLASWMSGSFSSKKQAAADSNFYDIRLKMIPIWKDRTDGYWLYVEQVVASQSDKPYRQRVYHLIQRDDSTFVSDVYTFDEPLRFAGAGTEENPLGDLSPDSLTLRDGCSIILTKNEAGAFVGSTVGIDCESTLRGAAYATSEVKITAGELYSWDRGFDTDGNQVWGSQSGGYIFAKIQ